MNDGTCMRCGTVLFRFPSGDVVRCDCEITPGEWAARYGEFAVACATHGLDEAYVATREAAHQGRLALASASQVER